MLQKVKKIFLISLGVFILAGAFNLVFNSYSRFLLKRLLSRTTGLKCEITGYYFNLFGQLRIRKLYLGQALEISNLNLKYHPISFLLNKEIKSLFVDSISITPQNFQRTKNTKDSRRITKLSIPVDLKELKINHIVFNIDSSTIPLNYLYLTGEGFGKASRFRTYVNEISIVSQNVFLYVDVILKGNLIYIRDFEINSDSFNLSGTAGSIILPDSANLNIQFVKFGSYQAKDLKIFINFSDHKLLATSPEVLIINQNFRDAKIDLSLDHNLVKINRIDFKYHENYVEGIGIFDLEKKLLRFDNIYIALNEMEITGDLNSNLTVENNKIRGTLHSENLRFRDSEKIKISANYLILSDKKNIIIDQINVSTNKSHLSGAFILEKGYVTVNSAGYADISDFLKDSKGKLNFDIAYKISKSNREGVINIKANDLQFGDFSLEKVIATIISENSQDNASLVASNLKLHEYELSSVNSILKVNENYMLTASVNAENKDLSLSGNLELDNLERLSKILITDLKVALSKDSIEITEPLQMWLINKSEIDISGAININKRPLYVNAKINQKGNSILLESNWKDIALHDLMGVSTIISGSIYASGALDKPSITFQIEGQNLSYKNELKGISFLISARAQEKGILIDSSNISGESILMTLNGYLPLFISLLPSKFTLSKEIPYNIKLNFNDLPIELLTNLTKGQFILDSAEVFGELTMSGNFGDFPSIDGWAKISKANGIYTPIQLELNEAEIFAEFKGDGFNIISGHAKVDHGNVNIKGGGKKLFDKKREIYLAFDGEGVSLYPTYNIFVSGNTKIDVSITDNLISVTGDAFVQEATIFQSIRPIKHSASAGTIPNNLRLTLKIKSEGNSFFINEIADIEVMGYLTFQILESRIFLDGRVDILKGYFLYLDRIFEIESGYIIFNPMTASEPEFHFTAYSKVDTFNVKLALSGKMSQPTITLSSEPPLGELNIIYLLTLGRPLGDTLSAPEDNIEDIKARAFTLASTLLTQNLRRTLKLQELRLENSEISESPTLQIGFYINPRLYFRYSHDISDITKDRFLIRYKLTKNLGIFTERDENQRFLLGINYLYEF